MKLNYEEHLSDHFTLGELLRSGTAIRKGILNVPSAHPQDGLTDEELLKNLRRLCQEVLEPLRRSVGRITITSGYRCRRLNEAVGGARRSQHLTGEAADIYLPNASAAQRYTTILRRLPACGQILQEPLNAVRKRWLHVGLRISPRGSGKEEIP